MEWDDLVCGLCKEIYNETNKIPRILISCGHTFCHSCLNNKIQSGSEVKLKN